MQREAASANKIESAQRNKKKVLLRKILRGGDIIKWLLYFFFISLSINFFVTIYTIYLFIEIKIYVINKINCISNNFLHIIYLRIKIRIFILKIIK